MKEYLFIMLTITVWFAGTNFNAHQNAENPVPYPEGYRYWTHVKTALIGPKSPAFKRFGGIHHIYANEKAVQGYASRVFQDGAILVADFLHVAEQENGTTEEGNRRFIDVMVKESQLYDSTGGWGFEEFDMDSKEKRNIGNRAKQQCFKCHSTQENNDFVFSKLRK